MNALEQKIAEFVRSPVITVGSATFANGDTYRIERNTKTSKQGCVVINEQNGNRHPASTIPKAWSHIRYMARVNQNTENTTQWRGFKL